MSIFNAMLTSVSGIKAQSYAIENVSGNIANAQTIGFKRVDTSFVDLIPQTPTGRDFSGSVGAYSRSTNTLQGQFEATGVGTHVAINGEGYFTVQKPRSFTNGNPNFDEQELYTRRGDFDLDRSGRLVNGSGYYLRGVSINPATGAPTNAGAGVITIDPRNPPRATTAIDYRSNLPSTPATTRYDAAIPGSELLDPASFGSNPTVAGGGVVTGADQSRFLDQSVFGGSLTAYDSNGDPLTLQLRWAKTQNAAGATPDTWELFYLDNDQATGAQPAWRNMGQTFTFNTTGAMTSAASFSVANLTVGARAVGPVTVDTGTGGLTQYAEPTGQVTPEQISQDGYGAGALLRLNVTNDARIVGTYSNGQTVSVAELTVAQFAADNQLKRIDGGGFEATISSGGAIYDLAGSSVAGGSLEQSNTDIAEEFSKMIVSQQAYNANTRVVSTAQQMLQELINVVR